MTAATKSFAKSERVVNRDKRPLSANVKGLKGSIAVCVKSTGYFQGATGAAGEVPVGYFYEEVDNTGGSAGAKVADIHYGRERTFFLYTNDTTAPVTIVKREQAITTLDNQTVSATAPAAGEGVRCYDVTTEGVWVELLNG